MKNRKFHCRRVMSRTHLKNLNFAQRLRLVKTWHWVTEILELRIREVSTMAGGYYQPGGEVVRSRKVKTFY